MDDTSVTIDLNQTEEEILTYEVSDEVLEAAAGIAAGAARMSFSGGECTTIPACFTSPAGF